MNPITLVEEKIVWNTEVDCGTIKPAALSTHLYARCNQVKKSFIYICRIQQGCDSVCKFLGFLTHLFGQLSAQIGSLIPLLWAVDALIRIL